MALNAKEVKSSGGKDRVEQPILESGMYPGRLVQIVDFGLQAQRPYQGKDKPPANEVMFTYELVDTFMVDEDGNELTDKPRWVSETFPFHNLKADKAKSTLRYNALDPEGKFNGDLSLCLSVPINVTLVQNQKGDKTYINVGGIAPMRPKDAEKCPPLINEPRSFDLDNPTAESFGALPEWIQTKIKENLNYKGSKLEKLLGGAPAKKEEAPVKEEKQDDDVPY